MHFKNWFKYKIDAYTSGLQTSWRLYISLKILPIIKKRPLDRKRTTKNF